MERAQPGRLTTPVRAAAQRLRIDSATAEVLRAFDAAGVESILIKGASTVRWLYADREPRAYVDCDLLLRPGDGEAAAEQLRALGFGPDVAGAEMPEWWQHAETWTRAEDGAIVDLHRTLPGVRVDNEALWTALSGETETLTVGGCSSRVLPTSGRALLVALHAAAHGGGQPASLADLELALGRVDEPGWRRVGELASSLGATQALAAGMRLLPAGRALAARLDLPSASATDVVLRAGGGPSSALSIEHLAQADGLLGRLGIVRHKLAPPVTYMRKWSPRARGSRLWLALAYAGRPIWLLSATPRGLVAWRRARRVARRPGPRPDRAADLEPG